MTQNTSGNGPYKYPLDVGDRYRSRITFQAIKVNRPNIQVRLRATETASEGGGGGGGGATAGGAQGDGLRGGTTPTTSDTPPSREQGPALEGISAEGQGLSLYEIGGEKCDLYLPLSFQVNDGFDYQSASLGLLGAAVAGAANAGAGVGGEVMRAITEGGQSILDLFSTGSVSRVAAVRGAQAIPVLPDTVKSAVSIAAGVTMNPNIRTAFNGVSVREFNFTFKFIPKSAEESLQVKNIIRFFRFHAYPVELMAQRGFSVALEYPNMFKIRLLSEVGGTFKNIGTPIKLSYLKTVSTTYNPTSAVLHPDGSPTEVDMTLTFTEYKPLSRSDILNEDNDTFYHYENAPSGSGNSSNVSPL